METLGITYTDAMAMPHSRRKRMIESKSELEQKRATAQRQAMQAQRARRGR